MIFSSGTIIITGVKNEKEMSDAYFSIIKIVTDNINSCKKNEEEDSDSSEEEISDDELDLSDSDSE